MMAPPSPRGLCSPRLQDDDTWHEPFQRIAQNGATTLFDYQVVILILAGAGTLQAQGAQLLTTSDASFV